MQDTFIVNQFGLSKKEPTFASGATTTLCILKNVNFTACVAVFVAMQIFATKNRNIRHHSRILLASKHYKPRSGRQKIRSQRVNDKHNLKRASRPQSSSYFLKF